MFAWLHNQFPLLTMGSLTAVAIITECKVDVLLEGLAVQQAKERAIIFIQYFYLDGTRPGARKRRKTCADLCEVGVKEGTIEEFFDLGFAATVKT